jgi:hypothetical protein
VPNIEVMKIQVVALSALMFLLPVAVSAQEFPPSVETLEQLKFDDAQVQDLFSLFFSKAPYLMDDSVDTERMVRELAPQALRILRPEQRRILENLDPQQELHRFGTMNRNERKRFVLDSARNLVHPSKQEWLDRVEEMTR